MPDEQRTDGDDIAATRGRVKARPLRAEPMPHEAAAVVDAGESAKDEPDGAGAIGTDALDQARVDVEPGLPIVRRIQASFRERIRSGELEAGAKLPSMRKLSADFGCSLGIVKQAVTTLAAQGYLRSSPRRGVFVAEALPAGREIAVVLPHLEIKRLHLAMTGIRSGLGSGLESGAFRIGLHAGAGASGGAEGGVAAGRNGAAGTAMLSHLCSPAVAGVMLLLPSAGEHDELRARLRERGVPLVSVEIASRAAGNRSALDASAGMEDVVTFDPDALAAMSVDHLAGLGHRRIAIVQNAADPRVPREVFVGLERALDRHGLAAGSVRIDVERRPGDAEPPWAAARAAASAEFARDPGATAVIGLGPQLTLGASLALRDLGRPVPGGASVIGILGDSSALQSFEPAITVVDNPIFRVCERAAARLGERIEGLEEPGGVITFKPEFVERGSVGPAGG